ncbi:hypothetical protein BH10CYA1_BH10CYA1_20480 [soil metagenome]
MNAKIGTYVGLFLASLCTLMYEILITRIFSATMWYHFAFMALSLVMFGLTLGSLLVFSKPKVFTEERAAEHMAASIFLLGSSIVVSFCCYLPVRFLPTLPTFNGILAVNLYLAFTMLYIYSVFAMPFVAGGVCICLALTKFPKQTSQLYAADLIGAALGCPLVIVLLNAVDIATAVFSVAALCCVGALVCSLQLPAKKYKFLSAAASLLFVGAAVTQFVNFTSNSSCLRLIYTKGIESHPIFEKWSALSCVRVTKPDTDAIWSWGINPDVVSRHLPFLMVDNDSSNGTLLHSFNGDFSKVDFLKMDITNFAHYLRPQSNVLVIGVGGGRDILSSLVFNDKSVVGVEVNPGMLYLLTNKYGDYTGHLDRYPSVKLVNDEARSYVTRAGTKFGIIEASLIDSFAATAAGAFAQTENSLYTVEGWKVFLDHLTDNGVITFSRPYTPVSSNEIYRLLALACEALRKDGVSEPTTHVLLIGNHFPGFAIGAGRAATLLVSKAPFSVADLKLADQISAKLGFEVIFSSEKCTDPIFKTLASSKTPVQFFDSYKVNLEPPTDDCPFFFNLLSPRHLFENALWTNQGYSQNSGQGLGALTVPLLVMFNLILITTVLTGLCILLPLWLVVDKKTIAGTLPLIGYFSCIGLGFMFVEVSQMQALTIFLGNPTYGLSVVLFTLLLSGGTGSFATKAIKEDQLKKVGTILFLILLISLAVFAFLLQPITQSFIASEAPIRILLCTALLSVPGFFMGMAFPIGMRLAQNRAPQSAPWLWGINGATSVCASVIAAFISLNWGIHLAFWTGIGIYCLAFVFFLKCK